VYLLWGGGGEGGRGVIEKLETLVFLLAQHTDDLEGRDPSIEGGFGALSYAHLRQVSEIISQDLPNLYSYNAS
jgi:hypothetical protein